MLAYMMCQTATIYRISNKKLMLTVCTTALKNLDESGRSTRRFALVFKLRCGTPPEKCGSVFSDSRHYTCCSTTSTIAIANVQLADVARWTREEAPSGGTQTTRTWWSCARPWKQSFSEDALRVIHANGRARSIPTLTQVRHFDTPRGDLHDIYDRNEVASL